MKLDRRVSNLEAKGGSAVSIKSTSSGWGRSDGRRSQGHLRAGSHRAR